MKNPHDTIIAPIMSEKSIASVSDKQYTFIVAKGANKTEIRQAVESVFGVKVDSVNTIQRMGKIKRQGNHSGRRPSTKKAIVKLTAESKGIEIFDSLSQ